MNNKLIGGIVVVVVLIVVGVVFVMNKNNSVHMSPQQSSPTSQTQSQTVPSMVQSKAAKNEVTIQNFAFSPSTLTVKAGKSITWTNQDSVGHSATADDNSFDTGILYQGQSKSITFSKAGTYTYHCSVHPMMKATIVVQ